MYFSSYSGFYFQGQQRSVNPLNFPFEALWNRLEWFLWCTCSLEQTGTTSFRCETNGMQRKAHFPSQHTLRFPNSIFKPLWVLKYAFPLEIKIAEKVSTYVPPPMNGVRLGIRGNCASQPRTFALVDFETIGRVVFQGYLYPRDVCKTKNRVVNWFSFSDSLCIFSSSLYASALSEK